MTGAQATAQQTTEGQMARWGRELAELVDEWSVTLSGPKAEEIAAAMVKKARQLLRLVPTLDS